MSKEQLKFLIGKNYIPSEDSCADIQQIYDVYKDKCEHPLYLMSLAFMYGVMVGKQQDRARRKKTGGCEK